ncbi:MAG TPA: hypothetical protein VN730_12485 [Steroidobacteraceae bacterium]|nr:hypothetical protein [Steroidobacteraceae bacterium]
MRRTNLRALAAAAAMAFILAAAALLADAPPARAEAAPEPRPCNRACLDHVVDAYLAALVAHDPSRVPIAADAKFVENTKPTIPGEGLWKTASAVPTTFKIYVPDPVAEQVGFLGMMQEDGKPIELALRLKLVNGRIREMEHLIARDLRPVSLKNLQRPRAAFLTNVPEAERTPRAEMLKIGASYYEALVTGNGKAAPFAADCVRHENGMQTTSNKGPAVTPISGSGSAASAMAKLGSLGCEAQVDTHTFDYIKRIEPRRVWIADPVRGLAFGLSQFRQPMTEKFVKIVGVKGVDRVPMNFKPFDLPAAHVFKIYNGKIHQIEAMGFTMPYDSPTGW